MNHVLVSVMSPAAGLLRSGVMPFMHSPGGPLRFRPLLQLATRAHPFTTRSSPLCRNHSPANTSIYAAKKKRKVYPKLPSQNIKPSSQEEVEAKSLDIGAAVGSDTAEAQSLDQTESALTWRDYDPAGGMPLPTGELSAQEIQQIFGVAMDVDTGNYVLSIMNWRRQSGALIDQGVDLPEWSGVTREQALSGLEFVRTQDPSLDEQAAGQQWADEEVERARLEIQERSIKLRLYKPDTDDVTEEPEESLQGTEYGRARSGESLLLKEREQREREWEVEQARKATEAQEKEAAFIHSQRGPLELGGGVQPGTALIKHDATAAALLQQKERAKAWQEKWERKATISNDTEIPQMSAFGRLAPALLMLAASLGVAWLLHRTYTPPPPSARMWPEIPPAIVAVGALTLVLVGAAIACKIPPCWPFVVRFMTIVPAYPYAASIVGAAFRHDGLHHLVSNLVVLWLVGPILHEDVGRGTFFGILLACAACGGFASLSYEVMTRSFHTFVFGASNAVLGAFAATCVVEPIRTVHVFDHDIRFAAWIFLAISLFGETIGLLGGYGKVVGLDFAGHLGGQLAGMAIGLYLRRQANQEKKQTEVEPSYG